MRSTMVRLFEASAHHSTHAAVDADLALYEHSRRQQLAALDPADPHPVAVAHRASVRRSLDEISAARARVADETYGTCVACSAGIPEVELELRPWSARCCGCARIARR